jgi:hypothetical protein
MYIGFVQTSKKSKKKIAPNSSKQNIIMWLIRVHLLITIERENTTVTNPLPKTYIPINNKI